MFTTKATRRALAIFALASAIGLYVVFDGSRELKPALEARNKAAASPTSLRNRLKEAENSHPQMRGDAHFDRASSEWPSVAGVHVTLGPDMKVIQGPRTWGGLTEAQISDEVASFLEVLQGEIELSDEQLRTMDQLLVLAAYTAKNSANAGRPAALRWLDDPEQRGKVETRLLLLFRDAGRVREVIGALDAVQNSRSLGHRRSP